MLSNGPWGGYSLWAGQVSSVCCQCVWWEGRLPGGQAPWRAGSLEGRLPGGQAPGKAGSREGRLPGGPAPLVWPGKPLHSMRMKYLGTPAQLMGESLLLMFNQVISSAVVKRMGQGVVMLWSAVGMGRGSGRREEERERRRERERRGGRFSS